MKNYWQKIFTDLKLSHFLILGSVFILAASIRFIGLDRQMTHVDDIGVAWTILVQAGNAYNSDYIRTKINDIQHEDYASPQFRLLRKLDDAGRLEDLLPYLRGVMRFFVVPQSFTYAPFQFILTPLLISFHQNYQDLLFWGRLPSFIFAVLSLIFLVLALLRLDGNGKFLEAVVGLSLLGFSWESIIYARHMSSYAIGLFSVTILFSLLVEVLVRQPTKIRQGIIIGFFLAIITSMQYQVILFLPAFFLVWLFDLWRRYRNNWREFKIWAVAASAAVIFLLPLAIIFILPQAHLAGEMFADTDYYFQWPAFGSFLGDLTYILNFFGRNIFGLVRFTIAILPAGLALDFFAGAVSFFALIGLGRTLFSKNSLFKNVGLFLLISGLSVIFLALIGKIALTPTRHSLIFLPYLILAAAFGIGGFYYWLCRFLKFSFERIAALALSILLGIIFFSYYGYTTGARLDFFNEKELSGIVAEFNPRLAIATDQNLFFIHPFKNWQQFQGGDRIFNIFENTTGRKDIFLLISTRPINDIVCGKMLEEAGAQNDCRAGSFEILLENTYDSGATLDILNEAHQIKNQLFLRVIRI